MQKLFNNKLFIISVLLIVLLSAFSTISFAGTIKFDESEFAMPDWFYKYKYRVFFYFNGLREENNYIRSYALLASDSEITVAKENNGRNLKFYSDTEIFGNNNFIFGSSNKPYDNIFDFSNYEEKNYGFTTTNAIIMSLDYCYSTNFDIKDKHNNSTILFPKPPVVEITETLVEETMKVEVAEKLKEMIAGFLKYLILFLISLIAFWKGWQFLSKSFRNS